MAYRIVKAIQGVLLCAAVLAFLAGQRDGRYMAIVLVLVPIWLLCHWLRKRMYQRELLKKPVSSVAATLVNHRQQFSGRGMRYEKSFLTFRLDVSGKEIEFEVSRDEFDRIQIGAKGTLRYRAWGMGYVSFRK